MSGNIPRGEARERILRTTLSLIETEGAAAATLVRVARETGVSRQAVYLFFNSRAGLLAAALRYRDHARGSARRLIRAAAGQPPAKALMRLIAEWFGTLHEIDAVARALEGAAVTDTDAAAAWDERMTAIRETFAAVLRRIDAEGGLMPGWTVETATDLVFTLTRISNWRCLTRDCGWSEAKATAAIQAVVGSTVLAACAAG